MEENKDFLSMAIQKIRKNSHKLWLSSALMIGFASLFTATFQEAQAEYTTYITITDVEYHDSGASIYVDSNESLELPDGSRVYNQHVRYDVSQNGVYTFHAFAVNFEIPRDSVLIDKINNEDADLLRTNEDEVVLTISGRDNLSGISEYRLRNEENGQWTDWQSIQQADNQVENEVNWTLNTEEEGIRTVYAQFRDQAGNITDSDFSDHGSTEADAAYARVIYTTQGPEFDVGIVDAGKLGSTYWVSPYREHEVIKNDQPYVELVFNNIRSEWSQPQNIYVSVNDQPFKQHPISDLTSDGRLIVEIPEEERIDGPGEIRIYIDDLVVNTSDVYTIDYFYDASEPQFEDSITQGNGDELERITSYNQRLKRDESHWLTETTNVLLHITPEDFESGVTRIDEHPGFSRILIQEQTRFEPEGEWTNQKSRVYASHPEVADGHPFTQIDLVDGQEQIIDFDLTHGLESRFIIYVTDNAGNTTHRTSTEFRQSNLRLISFKILDIVNPSREDDEVVITEQMPPEELPQMSAGGNVTLEATFDFMNAFDYENLYGQIEIEVNGNGYARKLDNIPLIEENMLTDKEYPRFEETFTIPEEAPVGAEVIMRGWLTMDMGDDVSHTIYFPSKNGNIRWRIGIIGNHIQDHLKFNITR